MIRLAHWELTCLATLDYWWAFWTGNAGEAHANLAVQSNINAQEALDAMIVVDATAMGAN